jgi:DNA-binding transcriptional ArsR family regulator
MIYNQGGNWKGDPHDRRRTDRPGGPPFQGLGQQPADPYSLLPEKTRRKPGFGNRRPLGVSQPVISKQLGILKKYDFVQKRKAGTFVYYSINDQDIVQIIDAMTEHLDHLDRLQ